jgi:hypothetical protein
MRTACALNDHKPGSYASANGARRGPRFSGGREDMGRRSTSQWVYPVASCSVRRSPLPCSDPEGERTLRPGPGETLVLVLLLSLGLWALIWVGVSVFEANGLR